MLFVTWLRSGKVIVSFNRKNKYLFSTTYYLHRCVSNISKFFISSNNLLVIFTIRASKMFRLFIMLFLYYPCIYKSIKLNFISLVLSIVKNTPISSAFYIFVAPGIYIKSTLRVPKDKINGWRYAITCQYCLLS